MDYRPVKNDIMTKSFKSFYIFTGMEVFVMRTYIHKIAEVSGKQLQRIDSVAESFKGKGMSLFKQSFCYLCTDDNEFMKTESAWDTIAEQLKDNILILCVSNIDKRSKFYKHFQDSIISFDYLDSRLLIQYIKKDLNLSQDDCNILINVCEQDYNKIRLEMDKIIRYQTMHNCASDVALHNLLIDGTIYQPPQDAIFDWCDAILDCKPVKAFRLLEECKRIGEPALRLLLVLYNNTKSTLQVQSCESRDVAQNTGLQAWEVRNAQKHKNVYSNGELVRAIKLIRETEKGIKTGAIDEEVAVPYVMTQIMY